VGLFSQDTATGYGSQAQVFAEQSALNQALQAELDQKCHTLSQRFA
jgi:hypothetical protein